MLRMNIPAFASSSPSTGSLCWKLFFPLLLFFARKERINFNILFYIFYISVLYTEHNASVDFNCPAFVCSCDGWLMKMG